MRKFLLLCLGFSILAPPAFALPAFPGAQGFGSQTVGGRGGQVIYVTNTNDSGTGSLREALSASGSRIVLFKTGGMLTALSPLFINNPYITVAGQTAPGNGFAIRGSQIIVQTHDVVIRGMRMRIGDGVGQAANDRDGIAIWGGGNTYNVIIDHNSVAWAIDENISLYDDLGGIRDVTLSWNISAEGLYCSKHTDEATGAPECHSMGALLHSPNQNISFHHNLLASNYDRNPWIKSGNIEVYDNVIYNWGVHPLSISSGMINAVGNIMISSSNSSNWIGTYPQGIHCEGANKTYLLNNLGPLNYMDWDTMICIGSFEAQAESLVPVFTGSGITATSAQQTYADVLASAGAIRDDVDNRIITYVQNKTVPTAGGWMIDSQNDVGGWPNYPAGTPPADSDSDGLPDSFEQAHGGNIVPSTIVSSGYTWAEEYINSLFSGGSVSVSPAPTPTSKPGDANGDGRVDDVDYIIWLNYYKQTVAGGPTVGDFNTDGKVDGVDYVVWLNNYGK